MGTLVAAAWSGVADAQLRIVSYNTANDVRSELTTVFTAIGQDLRNGIAKPIDVLALQEQSSLASDTQDIVDLLNGIYGPGTYARSTRTAVGNGGLPALVYNTNTVELVGGLLAELTASTVNSSGAARQTLRYRLRPVGYDESAEFYLYNSHYKASQGSTNESRRAVEAGQIRANADALATSLGGSANLIFAGDLNLYSSTEAAYQTLLDDGPGKAIDPLNPNEVTQSWNNSFTFRTFHTQSPCSSSIANCGVGGGVDSRFDFQLISADVNDGEGFALIPGSYRPFGNNGTTFNTSITSSSNTVTFPGVTASKSTVLNALLRATDHLPLVADYQLPAILDVASATAPTLFETGDPFVFDFTVSNAADVVAVNGADELDFTVAVTGDLLLTTPTTGVDAALGGGVLNQVLFDTFTPGSKSGQITVTATSQSAASPVWTQSFAYDVVDPAFAGDYNGDGIVNAADYTVWRDGGTLSNETVTLGANTPEDYAVWSATYGNVDSATAVPEPESIAVGLCLVVLTSRGRVTARYAAPR